MEQSQYKRGTNNLTSERTDFRDSDNRIAFQKELEAVRAKLGARYKLRIGGKEIDSEWLLQSVNPARHQEVAGEVATADAAAAEQAVMAAADAAHKWGKTPFAERARIFQRAVWLLQARKNTFAAWLVFETGKTWTEADAEAMDAIHCLQQQIGQAEHIGEWSLSGAGVDLSLEQSRIPLGAGVVIPPWSSPLAKMASMVSAALLCGNTVVLSPAVQSAVIAAHFISLLLEAGLPEEVIQFVPAGSEQFQLVLLNQPLVRFVSFADALGASKQIAQQTARWNTGKAEKRRIMTASAVKGTVIIDETADLAKAATDIVQAAFAFSGQSSEACGRIFVHERIYAALLEELIAQTAKLRIGDPSEFGQMMGPVIDKERFDRLRTLLSSKRMRDCTVWGGAVDESVGYYVQPTIVEETSAAPLRTPDLQTLPGPVMLVSKAAGFAEALAASNSLSQAASASVYSTSRNHLETAREQLTSRSVYLNTTSFVANDRMLLQADKDELLAYMQFKKVWEQF